MRERPILFSAPMVRAILAGRKTQIRRVVKGAPAGVDSYVLGVYQGTWGIHEHVEAVDAFRARCPYGQPGDRLWVRESFCDARRAAAGRVLYRATGDVACGWKPSIHMPRNASRINLEVTGVRIERLQAISRGDVLSEGVPPLQDGDAVPISRYFDMPSIEHGRFHDLWESINGTGSWAANPWVWVVEFSRVEVAHV